MNPRQRRGAFLLVAAAIGAIAVFISVLSFVADVNAKAGNFVQVVSLSRNIKAYQPIRPQDVKLESVPERWASTTSIKNASDVVGLVPLNDMKSGTFAQQGMFVNRPGVAKGHREIAIMVDAETGVAGKVQPGDRVDILATFEPKDDKGQASSQIWAQNALVVDVGVVENVPKADGKGGFDQGQGVPVTFALPTNEALRVAYAESFSVKVRLALRARNDESATAPKDRSFSPANPTVNEENSNQASSPGTGRQTVPGTTQRNRVGGATR